MKSFFLCLLGIIFIQLAYSADSKNIGSQPTKDEIVISKKLKTIDISKNEDVQNKPNVQVISKLNSLEEKADVVQCMPIEVSCMPGFRVVCGSFWNIVAAAIFLEVGLCGEKLQQ